MRQDIQRGVALITVKALLAVSFLSLFPSAVVAAPDPKEQRTSYGVAQEAITEYVYQEDGTALFTETYLPVAQGDTPPPAQFPTVVVSTSYEWSSTPEYGAAVGGGEWQYVEHLVPLGYAVTISHALGTGKSGGCSDYFGKEDIDAIVAVIDHIGGESSWSNGDVGVVGGSYGGALAIRAAARSSSPYLKAAVAFAPASGYENHAWDGVPLPGSGFARIAQPVGNAAPAVHYDQDDIPSLGEDVSAEQTVGRRHERVSCSHEHAEAAAQIESTGDYSEYWAERDYRRHAASMTVPTLMFHGFEDNLTSYTWPTGFFDRIPDTTPHNLVMGQGNHLSDSSQADQMMIEWFDRHLMELDNGVDQSGAVSLESQDGTWRTEETWPWIDGVVGQLALSDGGELGAASPTGSSSYDEIAMHQESGRVVFVTEPLSETLRISGQPVLDLWVTLRGADPIATEVDAHVATLLQVVGPDGEPVAAQGGIPIENRAFEAFGMRSARHLDPITDDYFTQMIPNDAPVDKPFRMPTRFSPVELVAPAGSTLRLTISGVHELRPLFFFMNTVEPVNTPSFANVTVEILHDCDHPSALRFLMPKNIVSALPGQSVRGVPPSPQLESDGGGIASKKVCEKAPLHPRDVARS